MSRDIWLSTLWMAGTSFAASALLLFVLLKTGIAWRLATDIPNDRSLHTRPTPRVGGLAIVSVVVAAIAVAAPKLWIVALSACFLAAVSQIDDRRGLSARLRFAAHVAAVVALMFGHVSPAPLWLLVGISVLLLWLINLYNFMDGADGLAGGMAMLGFAGYAIAATISEHPSAELTLTAAAVAGAATGFLVFNFHPAKVFMGDAGSIPLGFLAGALGYWGWSDGVWPIWFPAFIFSPFIGDASVTLLRRLFRRASIWQAHREHYYQRMIQYGLGHAKTAKLWYLVMAGGIMLALATLSWPPIVQWCSLGVWVIVLVLIGIGIDSRWRRFNLARCDNLRCETDAPT
ncbi:glycosyltransferase family 4 protein [Paraburkholderia graminis]|uniref:MraY family glycosyltransferase n=1 Tax=Paraburkholderia graminis TaxID=60548 RepID=UPI0038B9A4D6